MDTWTTLIAHGQAAKAMQPRERAFNDPAGPAQAAAVGRAPCGKFGGDSAAVQFLAMPLRVVTAIALNQARFANRATGAAPHERHGIDERQQLRDVVSVGGCQDRDERNPLRVGENMMLRPGFAAIGRVRSRFFPPRSARREELSTTARAKSSWPRRRSSASKTAWSRFQTPARCQRTSRRQQVLPEPQPISCGSMLHGIPLRRTKRIPVSTSRSGSGVRPAYRRCRDRRFGKSGSISAHNSSSRVNLAMRDRLLDSHATVPICWITYKY